MALMAEIAVFAEMALMADLASWRIESVATSLKEMSLRSVVSHSEVFILCKADSTECKWSWRDFLNELLNKLLKSTSRCP